MPGVYLTASIMATSQEIRHLDTGYDLYADYHRLRQTEPVRWDPELRSWYLTRYSDVSALLRDRRLSSQRPAPVRTGLSAEIQNAIHWLDRCLQLWMIFKEPPDHSRLRNVCNRSFAAGIVHALEPRIKSFIDDLIESFPDRGVVDFVESFAYPLPSMTIGEMIGVRPTDVPMLAAWSADIVEAFGTGRPTVRAARSYRRISEYFDEMTKKDTALTHLMRVFTTAAQESVVSQEELLANCAFLLLAGHDTTTNLIANGLFSLLKNPGQFARLRTDDTLAPLAVEELLRFESPIQYVSRTAREDLLVGDRLIRCGDRVLLSIGAANRDPEQFAFPDQLDIGRTENAHLAFIAGVHYCLGAPLARLEGRLVLEALVHRFESLELLDEAPEWKPDPALRSLKRLLVKVTKAAV